MSTRSLICYQDNEGTTGSYVHFDGYLEGNGAYLLETYPNGTATKTIIEYVEMGARSAIDSEEPYKDNTYYPVKCGNTLEELTEIAWNANAEFVYVYELGTNRWKVYIPNFKLKPYRYEGMEKYDLADDYAELTKPQEEEETTTEPAMADTPQTEQDIVANLARLLGGTTGGKVTIIKA